MADYGLGSDVVIVDANIGINSYKIATLVLFLSIFAPFWIAYSALIKIVLMQDRYEPS